MIEGPKCNVTLQISLLVHCFNGFLNILKGLPLHTLDLKICTPPPTNVNHRTSQKLIVQVQEYLDFISRGINSQHPGLALQLLMWIWNF